MLMKDFVSLVGVALLGGCVLSELFSLQPGADRPRYGIQGYFEERRGFHALLAIVAVNFGLFALASWVVFAIGVAAEVIVAVVMKRFLNPTAGWVSFILGLIGFSTIWLSQADPFRWW